MPVPYPTFRRFADPAEYSQLMTPLLLEQEAANCLQLGLLSDMTQGQHQGALLATVGVDGQPPQLSLMQTPPYRLILGQPAPGADEATLLQLLVAQLPADLPGVVAPVQFGQRFARAYTRQHGGRARLNVSERIYACHAVNPPAGVPGRMRRATARDRELLIRWRRAFGIEAVPSEPDRSEEHVQRDLSADPGGLWLWEVSGEPVAMAGARGPTPNGIRVGPVYTPPEKRNNGYAAALVAQLTQLLLDQGRGFVFLFTNLANPTANALYQRLGYRGAADRSMYDFDWA